MSTVNSVCGDFVQVVGNGKYGLQQAAVFSNGVELPHLCPLKQRDITVIQNLLNAPIMQDFRAH